jgi:diguanylate cyclase (GGDEF)-like protein
MLELISHVVKISSRRDRTEINTAMVEAFDDLFHPIRLTIHRCYTGHHRAIVFACAGIGPEGRYSRNAYLPDTAYCQAIEHLPLLKRCLKEMSIVLETLDDGNQRLVFPIISQDQLIYMLDLVLPADFPADDRIALMGLVEYFGNHIALLDYGEADTLTGIASRKTFDKHLYELLGKASSDLHAIPGIPKRRVGNEGPDTSHWLAVCDLDHFKLINDKFGHMIGDEVLVMLAQTMRRSFRFNDQLFRFGGEEFVALLQPATLESATATLERFRRNVEEQIFSRVGHVSISIGFSRIQAFDAPGDVIDRADEALYYAKEHGRNRVENYETLIEAGELTNWAIRTGEVELF